MSMPTFDPTFDPPPVQPYGAAGTPAEEAFRPYGAAASLPPAFAGLTPEPYSPADRAARAAQQQQAEQAAAALAAFDQEPAGNAASTVPAAPPADDERPVTDEQTALGVTDVITLTTGTVVRIRKLKTRELFALFRVAMAGLGGRIPDLRLDPDEANEVFAGKFLIMLLASLPESEDESMLFLQKVCEPVGLVPVGADDLGAKAIRERNEALKAALLAELNNPDPEDTIAIVEAIAMMNGTDAQRWGKRLAQAWRLFVATGQIRKSPTSRA